MITAVQDRLNLTLEETKNYLRVEHAADDDLIGDCMELAKEQADLYLQNEFKEIDEAGNEVLKTIPFTVKLAVLKMIATIYEARRDDVKSMNVGGLSVGVGAIDFNSRRLMHPYKDLKGRIG